MLTTGCVHLFFKACDKTSEEAKTFVDAVAKKAERLFNLKLKSKLSATDLKVDAELSQSLDDDKKYVERLLPRLPPNNAFTIIYGKVLMLRFLEQSMHRLDLEPTLRRNYPATTLFVAQLTGEKFTDKSVVMMCDKWLREVRLQLATLPKDQHTPNTLWQLTADLEGMNKLQEMRKTSEFVRMFYELLEFNWSISDMVQRDIDRFQHISTTTLICMAYNRMLMSEFIRSRQITV